MPWSSVALTDLTHSNSWWLTHVLLTQMSHQPQRHLSPCRWHSTHKLCSQSADYFCLQLLDRCLCLTGIEAAGGLDLKAFWAEEIPAGFWGGQLLGPNHWNSTRELEVGLGICALQIPPKMLKPVGPPLGNTSVLLPLKSHPLNVKCEKRDFPGGQVIKTLHFHCRWQGFNPWSEN